jgi:hypothetical protein
VARFLRGLVRRAQRMSAAGRPVWVNGQPGIISLDGDGRLIGVVAFDVLDGTVQAIRSVVNPDKLRHLGDTSQAWHAAADGGWDAAEGGWGVADGPAGDLASVHGHRLHRRDRGGRRHRQLRRDTR